MELLRGLPGDTLRIIDNSKLPKDKGLNPAKRKGITWWGEGQEQGKGCEATKVQRNEHMRDLRLKTLSPSTCLKSEGEGVVIQVQDAQRNDLWCCYQIVFQMQRLLEANCNTDPGSPWSIRFTWEPNFWTKQLASLGEPEPTLWAFT